MRLLVVALLLVASTASADTADYLDRRAAAWVRSPPKIANVACAISCHTTLPYLLARRHLGTPRPEIRAAFEARIPSMIARTATPYYGARGSHRALESHATEAVLTAVALLADDRGTPTKLTRTAIDHAWSLQRRDGGFDWLDFDIEPWESSEDWGSAMAVRLVDHATGDRRARLFDFLRKRLPAMRLHDRATLLWTSRGTDLLDDKGRTQIADDLARTQQSDGGFTMRTMEGTKAMIRSDAYATALGVLALCGDAARTKEVSRALTWLREHRAADGSFPAYSKQHGTARAARFATDAATAYATLALACKVTR